MRIGFSQITLGILLGAILVGWPHVGHAALCVWIHPERDMRMLFPSAMKYQPRLSRYTPAQQQAMAQWLGASLDSDNSEIVVYQIVRQGFEPVGTVLCNSARGQFGAIHTVVGFDLDGRIVGVLVQKSREPVELNAVAFLQQFCGKSAQHPITLGNDIQPIAGATVSCAAVVASVRESAVIFAVLHGWSQDTSVKPILNKTLSEPRGLPSDAPTGSRVECMKGGYLMKRVIISLVIVAVLGVAVWYAFGGKLPARSQPVSSVPDCVKVDIGTLLTQPKTYVSHIVTVDGAISRECPAGCWWYIKDQSGEIRVSSYSKDITLPLRQEGKRVHTTGKVIQTAGGSIELDALAADIR